MLVFSDSDQDRDEISDKEQYTNPQQIISGGADFVIAQAFEPQQDDTLYFLETGNSLPATRTLSGEEVLA
jgi:beta-N-acetylglucosaminidase